MCFVLLATVEESHRSFVTRVYQVGPDAGFSTSRWEEAATGHLKPCAEIKSNHSTLHLKDTKTKWPRDGRCCHQLLSGVMALCDITRSWHPQSNKPLWKVKLNKTAFISLGNWPAGQRHVRVKEHGSILHNREPIEKKSSPVSRRTEVHPANENKTPHLRWSSRCTCGLRLHPSPLNI